ncbi:Glycine-rich RNA-binding protein 4, mitochondrial [Apostasia shenzhenica]|uniref:Glycine-rich RNA-binding protein 4, mitochondrial n=1 Tax=Apostasia shenzhenica TaxID=1088818 RepID=A0A2I0AL82_9ASPA|nr:Glycine-rich RNA-binding protein 4, mitochondrial [Apostasia shenzhenica]
MGQQPPQLGDTTLTKVFVGGLAWETQTDALREHFDKFGEILEAVIISDRFTGRSKGYGFVTFKEAESARKACEDAAPLINGRRANCNLASLGARRFGAKAFAPATPITAQLHPAGATAIAGARGERRAASTAAPLPPTWYYPAVSPPLPSSSPFQHHHPFGFIPFYAGGSFG